ncbi:unannotated protein [freshwater metagenome]|uniref:Unannotated protein n=1 Tax=freshwater metagenome TaxID=449393 RepID=A0A6J7I9U4_9ZZZZ|nr:PAS domain-containing protein [Actinomycetota bacterium]
MTGRPDDASRFVPPALAAATSIPASAADAGTEVPVLLQGVRDRRHLNVLTDAVGRIPGVGAVATLGYERPDAPVLAVSGIGPAALAGEIRSRLGAAVASCRRVDGRVEVVLADAATVSGRPRAPREAPPRRPPPAAGAPGTRTGPPTGAGARAPFRPWTIPTVGTPWAQPAPAAAPSAAAGPAPAADRGTATAADPAHALDAFDAEDDLSILVYDRGLVVRAAHGGLLARTPRGREGLVGRHLDEVLPPATYAGLAERAAAALRGRGGELDVHSATGDRHYRITVNPVHDGADVVGCMSVTRDVTAQHRDAGLLRELSDVFETTFDRSPAGQALLSPDGRWLRLNDALRRLLGRDEDGLLGASLFDVTAAEDGARERDLLQQVLTGTADGYELEKRFVDPSGGSVHAFVRMSPVRAADGAVRGFVAHVVDAARWRPAGD